ncbi:MAG: nucleotidyltransferase domain-containing protein [Euryarchaeota archaeon]|nr:nucleotidyltransferase domain-containing protein [Euryarchaeota archaeon]
MPELAWTERALGSASKIRILRLLSRSPDRIFNEAEIARNVRMSPNTVNLALRDLKAGGLVTTHGSGRGEQVQFRSASTFSEPLRRLFKSEEELAQALVSTIAGVLPSDVVCVLFGSVARGEATAESDIDVLLVAKSHDAAAEAGVRVRRAARAIYKGRYNMLHSTPSELRRAWETPLIRSVRTDCIPISTKRLEDVV